MRRSLPDPKHGRAPGHADRARSTRGTGPDTHPSRAPRAGGPAPGHSAASGPTAADPVRTGSAGISADAGVRDPELPVHAPASTSPASCPVGSRGVGSPALRASLAEVLTRWAAAGAVCLCAERGLAPGSGGLTSLRHRVSPDVAPDPGDGGHDELAAELRPDREDAAAGAGRAGTAATGDLATGICAGTVGEHDAAGQDGADRVRRQGGPETGRSEDAKTPDRGSGGSGPARVDARTIGPLLPDAGHGTPSLPGRDLRSPGCAAADVIARLRSFIARHLPGADCTGLAGCRRIREPAAMAPETPDPGADAGGTERREARHGPDRRFGSWIDLLDASRPEPPAGQRSGVGCRACLDRAEQAERMWHSVIRARWSACADTTDAQSEALEGAARTRARRGVAGGGEPC